MARLQWKMVLTLLLVLLLTVSTGVAHAATKGKAENVKGDNKQGNDKQDENEDDNEDEDEKIALDKVPAAVKTAAEGAVKGIVLTKAEKETKGNTVIYEFDGKAGDKEYEIKVSSDGKVLNVKEEKEDDDKDDNDDDNGKAKKAVTPPAPPKADF